MKRQDIFKAFDNLRVLVVGDVMIDRYWRGRVDRISPEAPVPIVNLEETENRLGGAANVALNLKALGAATILCSVIGADKDGDLFLDILKENDLSTEGLIQSKERRTTVKSRVMAGNQQLLRLDNEDSFYLKGGEQDSLVTLVEELMKKYIPDVILFQDYNKGVLTQEVINCVASSANGFQIPTIVDPKFQNFWNYKKVTLFKPNLKEIESALGKKVKPVLSDLKEAAKEIRLRLSNKYSLITLSEKGVFIDDGTQATIIPTHPRSIADVCGAGDTVVSVAALGLALKLDIQLIAKMANLAGGQVCEKIGVVPVDKMALQEEMKRLD